MRLLGCCNVVARVLWVVARVVAKVPMMVAIWLLGCCYAVARVLGWLLGWLLGYPGWLLGPLLWYTVWLLRCCYAVARVPRMVARAVAMVHSVVAKVLLCSC